MTSLEMLLSNRIQLSHAPKGLKAAGFILFALTLDGNCKNMTNCRCDNRQNEQQVASERLPKHWHILYFAVLIDKHSKLVWRFCLVKSTSGSSAAAISYRDTSECLDDYIQTSEHIEDNMRLSYTCFWHREVIEIPIRWLNNFLTLSQKLLVLSSCLMTMAKRFCCHLPPFPSS